MKMKKNILYVSMLVIFMISIVACSDEKEYDFPGDPYNRVYMNDNSGSYKIVQTPISTVSNLSYETIVKCTQKPTEKIKVKVEVDNSMIGAYNEKNGTNYEALPSSALLFENSEMNILAGDMQSEDTLRLRLTEDESVLKTLNSQDGYIIPLRLTKTEGGNSQISTNIYYSYIRITVTEDNINHDATVGDIKGTLVEDQTGWSATTNATVYSYYQPLTYLFTTATSSYCYLYGVPVIQLDIDMGKPYTFDGVRLQRSSGTNSFASGMIIYTSDDGISWKSVGTLTKASTFVAFYAPITSRYIRITKSSGTTSNTTLYASIFNVYAK